MGCKTQALALSAAAKYIITYKNLYDQWIVTLTIEAYIVQKYPDLDHNRNPNRLAAIMAGSNLSCDNFTITNSNGIYWFKWNIQYY